MNDELEIRIARAAAQVIVDTAGQPLPAVGHHDDVTIVVLSADDDEIEWRAAWETIDYYGATRRADAEQLVRWAMLDNLQASIQDAEQQRDELLELRRRLVQSLIDAGARTNDVANKIGVTRQALHQWKKKEHS